MAPPDLPDEMKLLVRLCKQRMNAAEVWLFGSRARGDFHADSDYDVLAVIPNDAPEDIDSPIAAYRVRRESGAHADLLTVRMGDFIDARDTVNTISYAVAREGIRLDA